MTGNVVLARRVFRLAVASALGSAAAACASLIGVDDVAYAPDGGASDAGGADTAASDAPGPDDGAPPDAAIGAGRAATYRAAVLADAPIAYFRLADTTGTTCKNEIDGGYTAQYAPTPIFQQPGIFADQSDLAVRFQNGGAQIAPGADAAPLDFPHEAPYALECWVKLDADGGAGLGYVFNVLEPNQAFGPGLGSDLFVWAPSQLRVERWANSNLTSFVLTGTVSFDTFHHVVVTTRADATPLVYVDTILSTGDILGNADADMPPNSVPFTFGKLTGTLDEVAIYDHVLSLAQVTAHYVAAQ